MKNISRYFLWTILVIVILWLGFYFFGSLAFSGAFDKHYTLQETIENFNQREKEIYDLVNYFRKNKPIDKEVFFEPNGNNFNISIGLPDWAVMEKYPDKTGNNIRLNSAKIDTLLSALGWTHQTVNNLKEKIKKSNCLSIQSESNDVRLHYRTGTWSGFSYIIYNKPLSDSMMRTYNEARVTILRKNVKIAFSYAL